MRSYSRGAVLLCCVALAGAPVTTLSAAEPQLSVIVCAPGYPGTTETAQPTMDAFAHSVATAARWKNGGLAAEYFQTLEGGLARLAEDDAALALVDLPFYLTHRDALGLKALLQVTPASGAAERYSLVARRGALAGPQSLAGWEVHGMQGYAPRFVRGVLLADWGPLPDSAEIRFTSRIVSSLRRAAAGENVAVLLDAAQAAALSRMPFAEDVETVVQSPPLGSSVLCSVGGRLSPEATAALIPALTNLSGTAEGRTVLESMRMRAFQEVDRAELRRLEAAFAAAPPGP